VARALHQVAGMNEVDPTKDPLQSESIIGITSKRKRDEDEDDNDFYHNDNDVLSTKKLNSNEETNDFGGEATASATGGHGFGFGSYAKSNPFLAAASKGSGLFGKPVSSSSSHSSNNVSPLTY